MAPINRQVRNDTTTFDLLREELSKIRETLAVQNQVLATIVQRQDQSAQMATQQSAQLAVVSTDVAILKSEMPKFQSEINNLNAWKTDALNLFMPRREHEAHHHEERIAKLEKWISDDQTNKNEVQRTWFQWILDHALTIFLFLLNFGFALYLFFHH